MVFDYFAFARAKKNTEELEKTNPQNPVLKNEDEEFLHKVASHDVESAPLPPSVIKDDGVEVSVAASDAGNVALPQPSGDESTVLSSPQKKTWASYVPALPTMPSVPVPSLPTWKTTDKKVDEKLDTTATASDKASLPEGVTITENVKLDQEKKEQDEKEVSVILDRLNLSSINNRVFSFSAQSQKIYEDFTVVLKDMINGGPTAYEDMEKLLKDNDHYLRDTFKSMPPFVQTLVKSLPAKLGSTLGPEILAAASEKPGADMKARMAATSQSPERPKSKSKKSNVPNVKGLANQKGAVASMLRSIVSFLQARFPAFVTGTNIIMSLAVFILMFVFWYCHKRGKEVRLQKEADAASLTEDASDMDDSSMEESQVLTPETTETESKDVDESIKPLDERTAAGQAILEGKQPERETNSEKR